MLHCLIEALTKYNVCHPLIFECLPADKIITYTFPCSSTQYSQEINFPFRDVLRYGQNYVDAFNVSTNY